jgi:hypothetical protein
MMGTTAKSFLPVSLSAVVWFAAAVPAHAGIDLTDAGLELVTPAEVLRAPSPRLMDLRKVPGQTLRCWHAGRLVYEGGGYAAGPVGAEGSFTVPRAAHDGKPVTVYDMKDGMCMLSSH